jgi:hypothetical protein
MTSSRRIAPGTLPLANAGATLRGGVDWMVQVVPFQPSASVMLGLEMLVS